MTDVRLTATNPDDSSVVPVACNAKGELMLEEAPAFDGNVDGDLTVNGNAEFASELQCGGDPNLGAESGVRLRARGLIQASAPSNTVWGGYTTGTSTATSLIYADGSAEFAGGKAGFTAEGHLWCTTTRGDTVLLDFTSNGLATWVSYNPTKDRLREWAEKNAIRPKPEDSSQDEPETPQ